MTFKKEQISDEELEFIDWQIEDEQHKKELNEAVNADLKKEIERVKKSMDETIEEKPDECQRIMGIIGGYTHLISFPLDKEQLKYDCLPYKLNEINDTLEDMFLLLISAKYKTSRILLRKWLELVVVSIYCDTNPLADKDFTKKWMNVEDVGGLNFTDKLRKVSSNDFDAILRIYKELSIYTHNEGKRGEWDFSYNEKEFNDIFSKINQLQSYIEKMIKNKYSGIFLFIA
ncbi:MAG: hypothetical protein FIB07_16375 [Candidatus Methanoperedens sp.]|nr:hypothetical protein [Candidatus Methanoperedens sp.]